MATTQRSIRPGRSAGFAAFLAGLAFAMAACGAATPSPTRLPVVTMPPITIEAPAEVAAGAEFEVSWSGTPTTGDYLTIVPRGATRTNDEPYLEVSDENPGTLTAPTTPGDYEVWFVGGDTVDQVKARSPLKVT